MTTIEKDVLYPGVYTLKDGTLWECRDSFVREACANGNRMLRAGNTAIPAIWEHDETSFPIPWDALKRDLQASGTGRDYAAGVAKHTFGYVTGYRCGYEKGEPVLYADHAIPKPDDAEQFAKTRFVSPRVDFDFTDFNGRFWPGAVVTHIASTPLPIQMRQRPVMLSGAAVLADRRPNTSRSFVLLSLGERKDMAEETKPKEGAGGGGMDIKRLKAALSTHGIKIPDTVNDYDGLCIAVESAGLNGGGGGGIEPDGDEYEDENEDDNGEFTDANVTDSSVTPAMLSGLSPEMAKFATTQGEGYRNKMLNLLGKIESKAIARGMLSKDRAKQIRDAIAKSDVAVMLSAMSDPKAAARNRAIYEVTTIAKALGVKAKKGGAVSLSGGTVTVGTPSPAPPGRGGPSAETDKEVLERVKKRASGEAPALPKAWM